jgi:hypothetical protein
MLGDMAMKRSGGRPLKKPASSKNKAGKGSGVHTFKQPMEKRAARLGLQQQIEVADQIINEQPRSQPELLALQQRLNSWDSATRNLLSAIPDDNSLLSTYTDDEGPLSGILGRELAVAEEAEAIRTHLRGRVAMLEKIKNQLS